MKFEITPLLAALLVGLLVAIPSGCDDTQSSSSGPADVATDSSQPDALDDAGLDESDAGDEPDESDVSEQPDLPTDPSEVDDLYSLDQIQTFWVDISEAEWNGLLHDFDENSRNEVYRLATLRWGESRDTARVYVDVGYRLRGNSWTRERPELDDRGDGLHHAENLLHRTHFKIRLDERFDEDESVYGSPSADLEERPDNEDRGLLPGVETLNFKVNRDDPSYLREVLSYDLFRRFGVPAPRATYARVFLTIGDDPTRYMGVYLLIESLDADWIRRNYGESSHLFKCLYQNEGPADLSRTDPHSGRDGGQIGVEETDPEAAGVWPDFTPYRPSYDLKTRRSTFDDAELSLNALIELLENRVTRDELSAMFDVSGLMRAMAVNVFVGMADDYWRNGNNYYLVERSDDGRWSWVPYDYDRTFGIPTLGDDPATSSFLGWGDWSNVNPVLMERALDIRRLRTAYLNAVDELTDPDDGIATEEALRERMEELQTLIAPHVLDYDSDDPFPYDPELSEMLEYVRTRVAVARDEVGD